MPDRLEELRRQRALLQQHLDWLDREIGAETERTPQAPTGLRIAPPAGTADFPKISAPSPATPASGTMPSPQSGPRDPAADPDRILEQYRVPPISLHNDVRRGCFLYFGAALALFFAGVAILYFVLSRD